MIQPEDILRKARNLYPEFVRAWLSGDPEFLPRIIPAGRNLDGDGDLEVLHAWHHTSVKWTWRLRRLISHLITRETNHRRGGQSRLVRGTLTGLATLRKSSRRKFVEYRIGVVQPGLSLPAVSEDQLSILGATNSFVQIVTDRPLAVVGSM